MAAVFRFGNVEVDAAQRRVRVNGQPVSLGARAFDVLLALIERRDRVVSKDELLDVAWPGLVVEQGNVQVQVSALRAAIGRDAIATVQGFGYRFTLAADDGPADAPSAEPSADPLVGPATDTDRPTIAVLALGHAPGDGDGQALAQSLATEVVIELARNADLGVASALASFSADLAAASAAQLRQRLHSRYLVHGSVHRDAGVPWLDLALIDTADERLIWSLREPLNLPREALVRRIAGAVHARAWDAEVAHAIASPLNESDARALTMRSLASYREFHVDAAARTGSAGASPSGRPGHAPALAWLALLNANDAALRLQRGSSSELVQSARSQALLAIVHDPLHPVAWRALGFAPCCSGTMTPASRRCAAASSFRHRARTRCRPCPRSSSGTATPMRRWPASSWRSN